MICPVVTFCLSSNFWLAFSQYQDELLAWQLEGSTWTELGLMLGTILLDQPWSDCICGKRKTILKHPQTNDTLSSFMQHNCIRLLNWWHGKTYETNKTSFKNIRPRDAVMWLSKGSEVSFKQRVSWKISNAEIISLPSHKRMTAPHGVASYSQLYWKRRFTSNIWKKSLLQDMTSGKRGRESTAPLPLRKEYQMKLFLPFKLSECNVIYIQHNNKNSNNKVRQFAHVKVIKWLTENLIRHTIAHSQSLSPSHSYFSWFCWEFDVHVCVVYAWQVRASTYRGQLWVLFLWCH